MSVNKTQRPSLRLILLLVNLIILAIPISGLYLFRIYENELVRQTETELIAQAALVGAMFKSEIIKLAGPNYGYRLPVKVQEAGPYHLMPPRLDLAKDEILPRSLSYIYSPQNPESAALLAAQKIDSILDDAGRTTLSSVTILDYHGLVVAGWRGHGLSLAEIPEVVEALNGRYKSVLRVREGVGWVSLSSPSRGAAFRVFVAVPVMNGDRLVGVIHLSRTPREVVKALYQERHNLTLAGVLVLSLMVAVSLIASILIISPVKKLAGEALSVAEGLSAGLTSRPQLIVVREVAELRAAVSDMAERLRRRSDYLKAFASGVSHEFKTPLTSLKGAAELIGEHGAAMDQATRSRFENNMRADLDRLEHLVVRLLALARAEATSPSGDEKTDAVALAVDLAGRYEYSGLAVEVEAEPQALLVAVPADLLETVLRNLTDNSRECGARNLKITMRANESSGLGLINVQDDGPGVAPEDVDRIFTPFFTKHKSSGGTGLGLSLAKTLLSPYRGDLDWVGNDPGAIFTITLPLAAGSSA